MCAQQDSQALQEPSRLILTTNLSGGYHTPPPTFYRPGRGTQPSGGNGTVRGGAGQLWDVMPALKPGINCLRVFQESCPFRTCIHRAPYRDCSQGLLVS